MVTPNGFEKDFIPKGNTHKQARKRARQVLLDVAEKTVGYGLHRDALLIGISGRYEYKNKGIDVFLEAMNRLRAMPELTKDVIAFIMVPGWISGPRKDLQTPHPSFVTHNLVDPQHDLVMNQLQHLGFTNSKENSVKIIFVPSYLNGNDGIFNLSYYDLLIGLDLSVFPSYYEPWGYTPHESVAFSIPTITTSLSGFGVWAQKQGEKKGMDDGIEVIHRDDYNQTEVAEEIASIIHDFSLKSVEQINMLKQAAASLSDRADWAHFIVYYQEAYRKALHNSYIRLSKPHKLKAD